MKNDILRRLCLGLLCLLLCAPVQAFASSNLNQDQDQECSLTLHYTQEDQGLPDLEVGIYRVGQVFADGTYALVMPYGAYPVNIQDITSQQEWQDAATTLKAYIVADQLPPEQTGKTDDTGSITFAPLQTGLYLITGVSCQTEAGTSVFEDFLLFLPRWDGEEYCYHVEANPKFSRFTPVPQEEYSVLKLWQDEQSGQERPASIVVDILKNGQLYETVTLGPENNWFYSWSVPAGDTWTVVEKQVPQGYTVTISQNETAFVLTNTAQPDVPDQPDNPKTGDTAPLMLYILLACISGFALVILGVVLLRGKKNGKEG